MADRGAVLAELARRGKLPAEFQGEYNRLLSTGALGKSGATQSNMNFDNMSKLRTEFSGQTAVKSYRASLPIYANALKTANTTAGDLNLIYSYAKIMDPESVVRESETQSAADLGSLGQKLYGQYAKQVEEKGNLPSKVRQQMRVEIGRRVGEYNRAYTDQRKRYRELSSQFGYDPKAVIGGHEGDAFAKIENKYFRGGENVGVEQWKRQQAQKAKVAGSLTGGIKFLGFE